MQRQLTLIGLIVVLVVILTPTPQVYALPDYEVYYTIIYTCICGPCPTGLPVGEWTLACDGNMYGWGTRPYQYQNCHETYMTYGESCPQWPPPPMSSTAQERHGLTSQCNR